VGERHWGGFAERARVKAEWLNPLPNGLSAKEAMAIGTAGFTAMLCVIALEEHGLEAGAGEVVVTGAGGGIGAAMGRTERAETLQRYRRAATPGAGASLQIIP